ncbi:MAG: hypothetical protein ABSE62_14225 [Chthoniobacteraceae bacterium]|jgi:hypothetical protein
MNQQIYDRLLWLARNQQLSSYTDIGGLVGLDMNEEADRHEISRLLEEIARFVHAQHWPMLTALVIHWGNDNNPGEGFFAIAQELGLFGGTRNELARTTFWARQVAAVFAFDGWPQI